MRGEPNRIPLEKEHGAHTLKVWGGVVVGVYGDDVFVELGPRMQGVISRRAFASEPVVGAQHDFTLRGQEEGLWALALAESPSLSTWEDMEVGSLVQARVIRVAPGGLELKVGPLHAFMPKSHSGLAREERLDILVGKTFTTEVIEVDKLRQRVLVSRKLVLQRERASDHQKRVGTLAPGQVVQGRITRIEAFGAFASFGQGMEGLIHVSNLAYERVAHPADVVRVGDLLDLKVLAVKQQGKRIALGLKQMRTSPWRGLDAIVAIGDVVAGTVTRVRDFGAFVSIRAGIEGLLPLSQIGLDDGRPIDAVLAPDARVSVRVVDFDCERERMSLSLLHENGVRIAPDEAENRASFREIERDRGAGRLDVNLGSVLARAFQRSDRERRDKAS